MSEQKKQTCPSVGGQALIEGVMMRGPSRTVAAVRTPNGEIITKEFEAGQKKKPLVFKIPILRGVFSFCASMKQGYGALMYSAEVSGQDLEEPESKLDKWLTDHFGDRLMSVIAGIGMVLGLVLAIVLFLWLPAFLFSLLQGLFPATSLDVWRSVFEGVFRLVIVLCYMIAVSRMKDIHRVFQYHGAEHKSIFCLESGEALTIENVRKQQRFHPRCGTSFLVLMVIVGVVIGFFIRTPNPLYRTCLRLLLLPITMGIGYELIKFCGRHNNKLTRIIAAPGMWMQRITTQEPEDDMIEVAICALKESLKTPNDSQAPIDSAQNEEQS